MGKVWEISLVALVCIIVLGSALAEEHSNPEGVGKLPPRPFSIKRSTAQHRYLLPSPPPPHHLDTSPFRSFYSGPYRGPPRYEHSPPPPNRLDTSPFRSFYSGPYRGPPRYEHSPPPPHRLDTSPFRSFYSGPYRGPPRYEHPPPPHHV